MVADDAVLASCTTDHVAADGAVPASCTTDLVAADDAVLDAWLRPADADTRLVPERPVEGAGHTRFAVRRHVTDGVARVAPPRIDAGLATSGHLPSERVPVCTVLLGCWSH